MAYCTKFFGFTSTFAPASSNKKPSPFVVGNVGLKAGRSIPFILPITNKPLTTNAPVLPAEIQASARPSFTSVAAKTREARSEEHTSELQSRGHLVCRLLLEK